MENDKVTPKSYYFFYSLTCYWQVEFWKEFWFIILIVDVALNTRW